MSAEEHLRDLPCFQLYVGWRRAQAFYKPVLEAAGLNPQRMYVLEMLGDAGSCGVTELAHALCVELGSMSGLVSRMEREGLVERKRSDENRSEVSVRRTPRGRTVQKRVGAAIEAADRRLMESLAPGDVEGLKRVVAAFGEVSKS